MKDILLRLGKSVFIQMIAFFIFVGMIAYAAVIPWPTSHPAGTVKGGSFMTYFHQLFSKDCKSIKDFRTSLGLTSADGNYTIYPDALNGLTVYCDMTTSGGGWTKYVKIKGDYTWTDAYDCLKGKVISNSRLECFSPVYANPKQLLTKQGGSNYINDIPSDTHGPFILTAQTDGYYYGAQKRIPWNGRGYFDGMGSNYSKSLTSTYVVNSKGYFTWATANYIRFGVHPIHENTNSREWGGIYWSDTTPISSVMYMNYSSYGRTGPRCGTYSVDGVGTIKYTTAINCNRTNPASQSDLFSGYLNGGPTLGEIYFR